jgi:peptide alpha-N-acetyltransferase
MSAGDDVEYVDYKDESMLADIQALVARDLSEPYSIFTYRYFLHNWPQCCICVYAADPITRERIMIATIIGKAEGEGELMQGYIAMLAVDKRFRNKGIGSRLANLGLQRMISAGCREIELETEVSHLVSIYVLQAQNWYIGVEQGRIGFVCQARFLSRREDE